VAPLWLCLVIDELRMRELIDQLDIPGVHDALEQVARGLAHGVGARNVGRLTGHVAASSADIH
jgi:hypothetical protein